MIAPNIPRMYAVTQQLLAVLGLDEADISKPAALPGTGTWGFDQTPSLDQLEHRACRRDAAFQPVLDEPRNSYAEPDSYVASLESSHAFASNHCVHAMAEAYGISAITSTLSGSVLGGLADNASTASAIQAIRQQVDSAWSTEAVRRGVGCAKSGDYQQALECYNKALALNPNNCDACVARGAAFANQKQFEAAVADFETAVRLDPSNANAAKYLAATKQHMQDTADTPGHSKYAAAASSSDYQQQEKEQHKMHTLRAANKHGRSPDSPAQHLHTEQEQPPYRQGVRSHNRLPGHQQQQQHQQTHHSPPCSLQDNREFSRRGQQQLSVPDSREEWRQQGHKRPHSCSRSRSKHSRRRSHSSGRSRNSSSDSSSLSSGDQGEGHQVLKAPTAADIKRAIEIVRSANKEGKKDRRKDSRRGKNKKHKHKRKHRKKHKA